MKTKNILIVEDELIIAYDLKRIVENQGWNSIGICRNAEEAFDIIHKLSPDLILIDINLDGQKNGIYLGKKLLEKDTIPFIYITSLSDRSTVDEVKNTRPMGFILKPFKAEIIITTIEIVFHNHQHRAIDPIRSSDLPKSDIPFKLRAVIDYIHNNLDKKLCVEELAKLTNWQFHHFIRNFKKYLGVTPYQYILRTKIDRAKSLLSESNLPISSIAYDLGFQSHSSFSINFIKLVNITAEDYRRKMKNS